MPVLAAGHELRDQHRDRDRNDERKQDDDDELLRGLDRGGMLFGHGRGVGRGILRVAHAERGERRRGRRLSARLYRPGIVSRNRDGRGRGASGYNTRFAPVAQLDRVLVSEAKGHRFESCRARHFSSRPFAASLGCRRASAVRSVFFAASQAQRSSPLRLFRRRAQFRDHRRSRVGRRPCCPSSCARSWRCRRPAGR